eukprot:79935_1
MEVGYSFEQLERELVHQLHLKRSIIKMQKTHKEYMKTMFNNEMEFVIEHLDSILSDEHFDDELDDWYDKTAKHLKLSKQTVILCVKDLALGAIAEDESSMLDIDGMDMELNLDAENESRLYCVCQKRYDENMEYIQCAGCKEHLHLVCMENAQKITRDEFETQWNEQELTWKCGIYIECGGDREHVDD